MFAIVKKVLQVALLTLILASPLACGTSETADSGSTQSTRQETTVGGQKGVVVDHGGGEGTSVHIGGEKGVNVEHHD